MGMKVVVKVRFNTSSQKVEKFGQGMYLVYLPYPEDEDASNVLSAILSKQIGVPASRVEFAGKDVKGNFVFELM